MSQIKITNLTFAYDGSFENVFTDVSFLIDTDWRLGFCGRNGRGKTTFLNLLMGRYEHSGSISASVSFEYFPYDVKDISRETASILGELAPEAQPWQIQREISKLGLGEDTLSRPFASLSNGERTKALLAGLFLRENSFLLIDEPTNHLDMAGRELVADYLRGKTGFILVSHDRAFLDACTDHTLSINKANIEVVAGGFSEWWLQKRRQDAYEQAQSEKLGCEIVRLKDAARQASRWSDKVEKSKREKPKSGLDPERGHIGRMAAKMMKRSKTIERRREHELEEKSKLLKNIESAESLKLTPQKYYAERLVSVRDLALSYGGRQVFSGLSFTVGQGERLALTGGNGAGKSSVLRLICGERVPCAGEAEIGSRLKISYVPQDDSFLAGSLFDYAEKRGLDATRFMTVLRKLDFSRAQLEKDMAGYSAGQKKKVLLAASLCESAHLYVWDEPLNYIDVISRMQIEELLLMHKPTMLFAEHDRAFCGNIATKSVNLGPNL
jgi:lincosamide and streptogramin A transport system ATP-binding/permease protein